MNVNEAKEQIVCAMKAYFQRDEFGNPRIPVEKQRPVFLIGPPGVGKTAIMEQIAAELGVGLVSYSMTHHTRQSALGLPAIVDREFEGYRYQVSEYTMSEIIGAIYDLMRESGVREGILFLDEINCVSETLAPCMLQFLQYKVFGQHRIPDGWIVVTAGNPPEYNRSVRDFDIVTWDRLKRIDVEPDYETWKLYAQRKGVHPAVTTYLAARRGDFYKVESTERGRHFVTPRGWDDLSEMIRLYEEAGFAVDEKLVGQYLQDPKICREFAIYYDLFDKYRNDYHVEEILSGTVGDGIVLRASQARFDERVSLLGLITSAVTSELRAVCADEDLMEELTRQLRGVRADLDGPSGADVDVAQLIRLREEALGERVLSGRRAASLGEAERTRLQRAASELAGIRAQVVREPAGSPEGDFETVRRLFAGLADSFEERTREAGAMLEHVFGFCERAFADGDELLLFVTELTSGYYTARFIGHYGCDPYYLHNKELQFEERQQELLHRVEKIDWSV